MGGVNTSQSQYAGEKVAKKRIQIFRLENPPSKTPYRGVKNIEVVSAGIDRGAHNVNWQLRFDDSPCLIAV